MPQTANAIIAREVRAAIRRGRAASPDRTDVRVSVTTATYRRDALAVVFIGGALERAERNRRLGLIVGALRREGYDAVCHGPEGYPYALIRNTERTPDRA